MNPLVVILSMQGIVAVVNWPRGHVVRKLLATIRAGGTDKWLWGFRLLGWDGLLPVGVALVASGMDLAFAKNRIVIAVAAVVVSLGALFARGVMGIQHIQSNNCDAEIRVFQFSMLVIGMLTLLCFDAGIIVSHMDKHQPVFVTTADDFMAAAIVVIYLAAMSGAMYPGPVRGDSEDAR